MGTAERWVGIGMEVIVLAMVALSPWCFGCVMPEHAIYLFYGLVLLLGLWAVRVLFRWRFTWARCPVTLCLAAIVLLGAVQVIALPSGVLRRLAPSTARLYQQLLPAQGEVLPTGEPRLAVLPPPGSTISVNAGATRRQLVRLLALVLLFAVVRNNLASAGVLRRLSVVAVANGGLLSLFGLIQFFTTSEKGTLFWSVQSAGSAFGPFVNRDDFAFYINLCIGLGIGLLVSRAIRLQADQRVAHRAPLAPRRWLDWVQGLLQDPQSLWIVFALALMVSCVPFCLCRGGTLALLGGFAAGLAIVLAQRRHFSRAGTTALAVVVALMLLTWFGWQPVLDRLGTLWAGDVLSEDARLSMWSRSGPLIKLFPVWGSGYGTFSYVEPLALHTAASVGRFYKFAHNEYLQALIEGGPVRLGLMLLALGLVFVQGVRALRVHVAEPTWGLVFGALFAVTTMAIHSFVEFGLHIPAIALLVTVVCAELCGLGGVATGGATVDAPDGRRDGTVAGGEFSIRWFGLAPMAAAIAAVSLGWLIAVESRRAAEVGMAEHRAQFLRDNVPNSLPAQIAYLNTTVRRQPDNARLHLELGRSQLELFDMVTRQYPDIPAGRREVLRLAMLVPGLRHVLEARDLCPVWPESHILIARHVDQLKKADPASAYIERAKRLVPADPMLWYTAGIQELATGQADKAWRSWRRALELSDAHLDAILNRCAGRLTPQQILDKVLPDRPAILLAAARQLFPDPRAVAQRAPMLDRALTAWNRRSGTPSAEDLYTKAQIHYLLAQPEPALRAMHDALLEEPKQVDWRYEYAKMLFDQGRLADARRQLDLVLGQRPRHTQARKLLETIARKMAE